MIKEKELNVMKKRCWGVLLAALALLLASPAVKASSTRTVKDMDGQTVRIPRHVRRLADLWHANNQVVLLLDGQKKLVATTPLIKKQSWFTTVDPGIKKVTAPFAGNQIQVEELLKTKPDVVIAADPAQVKTARQAKPPTVNAMYTDFAGLKRSVTLTATILGGRAPQLARQYNQELDSNIKLVNRRLEGIQQRPTVVHFVNSADLTKVDGRHTIVDQWIKIAGGQNAITRRGNQVTVTAEELVKANPDVIIVGSSSNQAARRALKRDPQLRQLTAVKQGRVYGNPQGTFPWDRYSAEEALQVLWAAQKLHPAQMKGIDMVKQTQDFYARYYHYQLSKHQAQQILAGEN